MSNPARFLSRWSRLKRQAAVESPAVPVVAADFASDPVADSGLALPAPDAEVVKAQAVSDVDLTALMREELSEAVRKKALKAIFADPTDRAALETDRGDRCPPGLDRHARR